MNQPSFIHVPQAGFSLFAGALSTGPWARVDISSYENESVISLNAPMMVIVKLRLKRAIQALLQAMGGVGNARAVERPLDSCQRRLCAVLDLAVESNDPAKRNAARRIHHLLLGPEEGPTSLRDSGDVDLARIQSSLAAHGQAEADVALLGLEPLLLEIVSLTDSSANPAIFHPPSSISQKQKAQAITSCVTTFAWAADVLAWMVEQGANGAEKELARALFGSLADLAARYAAASYVERTPEVRSPGIH